MNKNQLAEQLKYCSPSVIYVVTWENLLKQVFCPFRVKTLNNIGELYIGEIVYVQMVKVTPELKTVFVINGNAYYYYHFDIII